MFISVHYVYGFVDCYVKISSTWELQSSVGKNWPLNVAEALLWYWTPGPLFEQILISISGNQSFDDEDDGLGADTSACSNFFMEPDGRDEDEVAIDEQWTFLKPVYCFIWCCLFEWRPFVSGNGDQLWARSIGEAISISTQNRDRDFLTSLTHPNTSG